MDPGPERKTVRRTRPATAAASPLPLPMPVTGATTVHAAGVQWSAVDTDATVLSGA